jgi:uncharacterized protein (DUF362 family)
MRRRDFVGAMAGVGVLATPARAAGERVAIAKCMDYGASLMPALRTMMDQIGGLKRIVKGKTVAMKVNLTGSSTWRLSYAPIEHTHWTHPAVVGSLVRLMGEAGARQVRILESAWQTADPLEEVMLEAGWEPRHILNAAASVEMENTNWLGRGKAYRKFTPPNGGHMFPAYVLNHSYEDCDVFVSVAKLKEHATAGVTMSLKNLFGIAPCTIYGDGAGVDEPSETPRGGRGSVFHFGRRQPAKIAPPENDPKSSREGGYRVPRIVADLCAARPIHLAIIDGIYSMHGGEGPWNRGVGIVKPGLLIAGTNAVNTDAVGASLMGFDPMAGRGTMPFETCDNTLALAEQHGLGTRDMSRIEVVGVPIEKARTRYREVRS